MYTILKLWLCSGLIIRSAHGFSCPCHHVLDFKCKEVKKEDCPFGLTSDTCGCCSVCTKAPGEMCGGRFMGFTACSDGYSCRADPHVVQLEGYNTLHYCITNSDRKDPWRDFFYFYFKRPHPKSEVHPDYPDYVVQFSDYD